MLVRSSEDANLQKRIVFMTCAYFAGIDSQDRCHPVSYTHLYASEQIWHEVKLLREAKHVVVSMGGMAA